MCTIQSRVDRRERSSAMEPLPHTHVCTQSQYCVVMLLEMESRALRRTRGMFQIKTLLGIGLFDSNELHRCTVAVVITKLDTRGNLPTFLWIARSPSQISQYNSPTILLCCGKNNVKSFSLLAFHNSTRYSPFR